MKERMKMKYKKPISKTKKNLKIKIQEEIQEAKILNFIMHTYNT